MCFFSTTILPWKCSPVFSFFHPGVDFSVTPDFCPAKPYFSFYYGTKSFFVFLPTLVRPSFPNIAKSSFYFEKKLNIFSISSGNYNYSIIGKKIQEV